MTTGWAREDTFGALNDSGEILVIVDEAHRSHASTLHANLVGALPNAARIGFTGTPIIMGWPQGKRRRSSAAISTNTRCESPRTTAQRCRSSTRAAPPTPPCEAPPGWMTCSSGGSEISPTTSARRSSRGTRPRRTCSKCPNWSRPRPGTSCATTSSTVMPGGFKGMIVATSREACVRYYDALDKARNGLLTELEQPQPNPSDGLGASMDPDASFLRGAASRIDLIRALRFAPVISGDHNDPLHYAQWTDKQRQQANIDSFKLPLGASDKHSPLGLLIVKSMLLTGFDAPQAQVIYLDRMIQQAELLQAVARVNRTAPKKEHGLVVDYYGVSAQLTQALAAYTSDGHMDPDAEAALRPLTDEIEKLESQRQRIRQIFVVRGVEPAKTNIDDCVHLLADEKLRAEFDTALRTFLATFDTVLPRPEALPYVEDASLFGEIQIKTRRRYRDTLDGDFDPYKYKEKVRWLLDEHITALDLSSKIEPVRITAPEFAEHIGGISSQRTKASEMEHAVRFHIREHLDEDPVYYEKLSKRVDEILGRLKERWEQIALEFQELIAEVQAGRTDEDHTGLDPATELPFHNLMVERVASPEPDTADRLINRTSKLVAEIRRMIGVVGFWDNATKQDDLRKSIKQSLDDSDLFDFDGLDELAVELVALAKANQHRLR